MIEHANEIATWFLVLTLFFPRIGLLIAWNTGDIPFNSIPFWGISSWQSSSPESSF